MPTTWDEFFAAADKIKAAGIIAVAHGGQNWQDFTIFETVALGVGGADFYKKALVQLDPATLNSADDGEGARRPSRRSRATSTRTPRAATGTWPPPWSSTARPACSSWATGPRASSSPPARCRARTSSASPAPGTAKAYTFNIDSFAMFKLKNPANAEGQQDLAKAIMSPEFQERST